MDKRFGFLLGGMLVAAVAFGAEAISPISLSDPDGQELLLEELTVQTAVHGMLSLTELEMRFRNPRNEVAEGRFTCILPAGATISRFAKEVNGALMEGEVVERLRANQIYDEILHQMRDPALLEQDQGNRFSARIFPIPARDSVRLVLSYTELLPAVDGFRSYVASLRGLPRVDKFTFHALLAPLPGEGDAEVSGLAGKPGASTLSSARVIRFSENDYVPEDIELRWSAGASGVRVLRAGDFYLASFIPPGPAPRPLGPASWLVYLDTSASAASGEMHRLEALEELFGSMPAGDAVEVVAFDQSVVPLFDGSAGEAARRIAAIVRERRHLGGTDLGGAVADLRRRVDPGQRVLFITDGAATQGATSLHDLTRAFEAIPRDLVVHAAVLGSAQDAATLRALTRGRGRVVTVGFTESMREQARAAAEQLRAPAGETMLARDSASEWLYPVEVGDVRPGREVFVVGKTRPSMRPAVGFVAEEGVQASAVRETLLPADGFEILLEREAYRGYLEHLREREASEESEGVRRALAQEQIRVSVERRIMIPLTTMLVLETEQDYVRFGLDRRALADILTVGLGGITMIDRPTLPRFEPRREKLMQRREDGPPPPAVDFEMGRDSAASVGGEVAEQLSVTAAAPEIDTDSFSGALTSPAAVSAQRVIAPPPPPEPPLPPPLTARPEETRESWGRRGAPDAARLRDLLARLDEAPRDRALYNELSEAFVAAREWQRLRDLALRWQPYDPENPQVYEVLSEASLRLGRKSEAVRAAGSLVEVAPSRPELLQRAGLLLLRIAESMPADDDERARVFELAEAPARRAVELRPDRVNAHRHLALILWRAGKIGEAARVLEEASRREFPQWYGDAQRVIREELAYVYRAWMAAEPAVAAEIRDRASRFDADLGRRDDLRITLVWETDANDVDLHVMEPSGQECYYSNPKTATLELYQDITQGFGPEVVRSSRRDKGTYRVGVNYFSAGPMGVSRGIVVIFEEGQGGPSVSIVPFRLVDDDRGSSIREVART